MKLTKLGAFGASIFVTFLLTSCNLDSGNEETVLPTYRVQFDTGLGTKIEDQLLKEGEKVTRPKDPVLEDYTFEGWFISLEEMDGYDFDSGVYRDTTLYAHYTIDVIIDIPTSDETIRLGLDETYQLTFNALNREESKAELAWEVDNPGIISVTTSGLITGLKEGIVELTITSKVNTQHSFTINIIVGNKIWDGKTVETIPTSYFLDEEEKNIDLLGVEAFMYFAHEVNNGNTFEGYVVNLLQDLDLQYKEFTPIGSATRSGANVVGTNIFKGTFDGHGTTISRLSIKNNEDTYATGLFSGLSSSIIKNLNIKDAKIVSPKNTHGSGILAGVGDNSFIISNVTTDGYINGYQGVGGILGRALATGSIIDSINYAIVTTTTGGYNTGGLVGAMYYDQDPTMSIDENERKDFMIKNSVNHGTVSGNVVVGGLVGLGNTISVSNSTNNGQVMAIKGDSIGGLVGGMQNGGYILNSINNGSIVVTSLSTAEYGVGGLVGWIRYQTSALYNQKMIATIRNSINNGEVTSNGTRGVGGIVGSVYWSVIISDTLNNANINNLAGVATGGIIGNIQFALDNFNEERANTISLTNTYSMAAKINSMGQNVGTVVGHIIDNENVVFVFDNVAAMPINNIPTGIEAFIK